MRHQTETRFLLYQPISRPCRTGQPEVTAAGFLAVWPDRVSRANPDSYLSAPCQYPQQATRDCRQICPAFGVIDKRSIAATRAGATPFRDKASTRLRPRSACVSVGLFRQPEFGFSRFNICSTGEFDDRLGLAFHGLLSSHRLGSVLTVIDEGLDAFTNEGGCMFSGCVSSQV